MTVRFYRTARGTQPVRDYIQRLDVAERALVLDALKAVEANGLEANVTTRNIDGKLWEIRVSAQRVFYVVVTGPEMVLLHAYKKQGQKAPSREIETARKRMKDVLR